MKTIERVLLFGAGLLLSLKFLHAAPTLLSAQSVPVGELESSQVQSIGEVQTAPPDSIVQLTAEAQGLARVAPADLPKYGTYWLVMPGIGGMAPLPCPPDDPGLPVYQMADGQFLVDETGGQVAVNSRRFGLQATSSTVASALAAEADAVVNLINQVQAAQFNRELAAVMGFDEELDSPGTFSPMLAVYDTNALWLEIIAVTNHTASLVIHPPWNVTNGVYDLYYTTNLAPPISWRWLLRSNPGQTNLIVPNAIDAQGFYRLGPPNDLVANDSLGTNFWLAFFNMASGDGANDLSLYISSPVGATGTVTIPGLGITNTFSVAAGAVTNMDIDPGIMIVDYDLVETNGIQIITSHPVSVYAVDYDQYLSSAFTCYPTTFLGTNYCVMARTGIDPTGLPSQFAIVATADGTTVTITPSPTAVLAGHTSAYTKTLQQGQTYQINDGGTGDDITGTRIKSDKPVAVFAGDCDTVVPFHVNAADNPLVQEQLPVADWGKQALAMPFAGRKNGDSYRVLAAYDGTVVTISGIVVTVVNTNDYSSPTVVTTSNEVVVVTNQAGQFYDIIVDGPVEFQANQPIQVAQFANGGNFDGAPNGDPCEILLLPTGHYLETNTVVTLPNDNVKGDFYANYMSLIVAQSAITNTLVDGFHVAATNFVPIGTSGYYGAQITITNSGAHKVTSSQPVGVEVYGFGNFDAYGYFGGVVK